MLEVKSTEGNLDPNLKYFNERYGFPCVQLVAELQQEYKSGSLEVRDMMEYL